jgi:hypothetical protein
VNNDEYAETWSDAWDEFERGFRQSQHGNLCRTFDGLVVTVFRHRDGTHGWSIAEGGEVRYSSRRYKGQESAMMALFEALGW